MKKKKQIRKPFGRRVAGALIGAGNGLVSLTSGLLATVLILYSGYVLVDTMAIQHSARKTALNLMAYKPELIEDYQTALAGPQMKNINKDYRAWVSITDTSIDYPVVQGENDLYYASHDIYNQSSLTGSIYLAAANQGDFSDSYNLLYGHHMDNGAMFGSLDAFVDPAYFESHREGIIATDSGIYDIEFFAAARTDAYENRIYKVGNRMEEVLSFLAAGGEGGVGVGTDVLIFDAAVAESAEKLIALSTCADTETNGRMVLFGALKPWRRAEEEEEEEELFEENPPEEPEKEPEQNGGRLYPEEGTPVQLVIRYQTVDGETLAPAYRAEMESGSGYSVDSPEIGGYRVLRSIVEGTLLKDTEITVLYVPLAGELLPPEEDEMVEIDDFGTPLGLGNIYVNTGDCWD